MNDEIDRNKGQPSNPPRQIVRKKNIYVRSEGLERVRYSHPPPLLCLGARTRAIRTLPGGRDRGDALPRHLYETMSEERDE